MKINPRATDIDMSPGDNIKIRVGINYICDIVVKPNGRLRIYYNNGRCLEP